MDEDLVVEKVGEVLKYIDTNDGNINNMNVKFFRFIPTYIWRTRITSHCMENAMKDLSNEQKCDLLLYRPCHYHFNNSGSTTEYEGSAPPIIRCQQCKETFI